MKIKVQQLFLYIFLFFSFLLITLELIDSTVEEKQKETEKAAINIDDLEPDSGTKNVVPNDSIWKESEFRNTLMDKQ